MARASTQSIEIPQGGYPSAAIDTARATLRTCLPGLLSVRMDHVHVIGQSASRLHVLMDGIKPNQPSRTLRLQCASHRGWRGNFKLGDCMKPYLVPDTALRAIEGAFNDLRECNAFGAWAIQPEVAANPLVLSVTGNPSHETAITPAGGMYLTDLVEELQAILPTIARIDAERVMERDTRGQRRRHTYVRFTDHAGRERAALDSSLLGVQLRASILPEQDPHCELNASRQAWWEEQLQVDRDDLPVALHTLYLLFASLPVDAVQLAS